MIGLASRNHIVLLERMNVYRPVPSVNVLESNEPYSVGNARGCTSAEYKSIAKLSAESQAERAIRKISSHEKIYRIAPRLPEGTSALLGL